MQVERKCIHGFEQTPSTAATKQNESKREQLSFKSNNQQTEVESIEQVDCNVRLVLDQEAID